jgi:hypothetical protein
MCFEPICNHWLFFDELQSTITMCLKCWEKITNPLALVNLIDDDFGIKFKSLLIVFSLIGSEEGVSIFEEYNK